MFTRYSVLEQLSPASDQLTVVFQDDETEQLTNVTLHDTAPSTTVANLRAQLVDTPRTIPNPAFASLQEQLAAIQAQLAETPAEFPNPDRAPLEAQAFALAEPQLGAN